MKTKRGQTVRHEIRIRAPAATVFALLTDAQRMTAWLARNVKAEPRPGGMFRLVDFGGFWVEGLYLEVIPHRRVVFSWGGIEGLKLGESTTEFTLRSSGRNTLLRLRHFGLSPPSLNAHRFIWKKSGLPKLKAVAEGKVPGGTCLGDAADSSEQHPCWAFARPWQQSSGFASRSKIAAVRRPSLRSGRCR
jgi:uncharacterized protein YndB with AHSA1/START domain